MMGLILPLLTCAGAAIAAPAPTASTTVVMPEPAPPAPEPLEFHYPPPPQGAPDNLDLPPLGADGLRQSLNRAISPAQTLWNLRSAYNVAALNCVRPEHAALLPLYRRFLKTAAQPLAEANRAVSAEFIERYGPEGKHQRDQYLTAVYNHFAFPPTLHDFCDRALAVATDGRRVKPAAIGRFAADSLPALELVFDQFYDAYEKYKADRAALEAQYAAYNAAVTQRNADYRAQLAAWHAAHDKPVARKPH